MPSCSIPVKGSFVVQSILLEDLVRDTGVVV